MLVRTGETEGSEQGKLTGVHDYDLSPLGDVHGNKAGEFLMDLQVCSLRCCCGLCYRIRSADVSSWLQWMAEAVFLRSRAIGQGLTATCPHQADFLTCNFSYTMRFAVLLRCGVRPICGGLIIIGTVLASALLCISQVHFGAIFLLLHSTSSSSWHRS